MAHLTPIRVRFSEVDPYGHVNHAVYVTWFEVARTEALRDLGIRLVGEGASDFRFVVSELEVKFRSSVMPDELVTVESSIIELRGASSRWRQRVLRDGAVLAEGSVRIGLVDSAGRVTRMPDDMRTALAPLLAVD
jgi:acyl-CoA thioester hydrolase